ncbi:MAG: 23S rRNA (pseudouridine(1915)-N(3))-methyltransferase RlmH [Methylobacterium sp.]|nr:23S rRNA (pseudouridine(1915)-N(3))-methyltransferase RlmH [Methylobacterium sp.]
MKLDLVAIGRMKAGPERELANRYLERFRPLGRGLGLDGIRLVELSESAARRDEDRKAEEALAIAAVIPEGYARVVFDERGQSIDSATFARRIGDWRTGNRAGLAFVIGGADGLASLLVRQADLALSFGRMTLPHQMVRVLAAEQLYRAATILAGHPYHRS